MALGSYGASLTLGFIRLPFQGTKWTEPQRKFRISSKNCVFQENFAFMGALPRSTLQVKSKLSGEFCRRNELVLTLGTTYYKIAYLFAP